MKKYKIFKLGMMTGTMIATMIFSGCSKDVECNVDEPHAHKYIDQKTGVSKYILGEKDHVWSFERQEKYKKLDEELRIACNNDLCSLDDNKDYFVNKVVFKEDFYREEYREEYVYGSYFGYAWDYDPANEEYRYFYGRHIGYHWESDWYKIPLDVYTNNLVRDTYYKIKLYRICEGEVNFRYFESMDDIDERYNYFKQDDLIVKQIGESYYLNYKYHK